MPFNNTFKLGWIYTSAILIVLLLPILLQQGMFLDGITYASISKNLANGFGSLWFPQYTQTHFKNFHEHPPLVFGIQSIFFSLFGDGFLTERIYSFFTAILTAIGIVLNWNLFNKTKEYSWLPVLLWIATPIIFWSYQSNMLENTLTFWCLFSVYFISKGSLNNNFFHLALGGVFILLAFLSKGPVGLFPLATVGLLWLTNKEITLGKTIFYSLIVLLSFILNFYLVALWQPNLIENLQQYYNIQVLPSVNNSRETTTGNHFAILGRLFLELSFPIVILVTLLIFHKNKKITIELIPYKTILFFILIGLSASAPLIVTLKQRGYYLVTALPYFIIGLSFFIVPYLKILTKNISQKRVIHFRNVSYIFIAASLLFSFLQFGKYSRDELKIEDIKKITKEIPKNSIIGATPSLVTEWGTVAYLVRYGNISMITNDNQTYILTQSTENLPSNLKDSFKELDLNLNEYKLYKRK